MRILHLNSSILGANSVSRTLSADIVARLTASSDSATVTYRDLVADPVPHLTGGYLFAAQNLTGEHAPEVQHDLAVGGAVLQEFLAADVIVIGVAFYNFGIPSQLKTWVDRILIAGQTFRYGADGRPEGLCEAKRVIIGIARGGFYGPQSPIASFEHAETYLRTTLGFLGITRFESVAAEGVAVGPEQRQAALNGAAQQIAALTI